MSDDSHFSRRRNFWLLMNAVVLMIYALALLALVTGAGWSHPLVLLSGLILAVHALEIPLANRALAGQQPQFLRMLVCTILFGVTWWLPARWGVYRAHP